MKKLLFAVAFSLVGFAAQAQCSESCHSKSADGSKKCTVSKKGEASIKGDKGEKSVATVSKKRRNKKIAVASTN